MVKGAASPGTFGLSKLMRATSTFVGLVRGFCALWRGGEVFNLEVHKEHRYFVGKVGVVAHNACVDPTRPAGEVLPGSLRRVFPGEHLGKSLNEIKDALRTAKGSEVKPLQTAKKLLEQAERLLDKAKKK